jgi:hypothetical protein
MKTAQIKPLDPEKVFNRASWKTYTDICDQICKVLVEADSVAVNLDQQLMDWLKDNSNSSSSITK